MPTIPNVGYNAFDGNYQPIYGGTYYDPGVVKSTSGAAGTPGAWSAAGSVPPADAGEAAYNAVTASPTSAWTTGQYTQGRNPAAAGQMHWTGSAWAAGKA
jgi:hypothetical protein